MEKLILAKAVIALQEQQLGITYGYLEHCGALPEPFAKFCKTGAKGCEKCQVNKIQDTIDSLQSEIEGGLS